MIKLHGILKEMDILWRNHNHCRSYFPRTSIEHCGETERGTAPWYRAQGFNPIIHFDRRLNEEDVQKIHEIAHFMNQNFIVRLWAIVDSHDISCDKGHTNHSIPGWKAMDILSRLRNVIGHESGRYDSDNKYHQKLLKDMRRHFPKIPKEERNLFPLSISEVLFPLFLECKGYVQEKITKTELDD